MTRHVDYDTPLDLKLFRLACPHCGQVGMGFTVQMHYEAEVRCDQFGEVYFTAFGPQTLARFDDRRMTCRACGETGPARRFHSAAKKVYCGAGKT